MKSLLYLINIVVSFFFLLFLGIISGGFIFSFLGGMATLGGATAGAVIGICGWFKFVGFIIEKEEIELSKKETGNITQLSVSIEGGIFVSEKDARFGNHLMIGGVITFLSSLIDFSTLNLVLGLIGVGVMVIGFIISIAAYEFPSDVGILRRVKLLRGKHRT